MEETTIKMKDGGLGVVPPIECWMGGRNWGKVRVGRVSLDVVSRVYGLRFQGNLVYKENLVL